jgi:hypothetical protein
MNKVIKAIAVAAVLIGIAASSLGQELRDKTKRMLAVEKKFKITMTMVVPGTPTDLWIFMSPDKDSEFHLVPIVVKSDAKDGEIQAACLAVGACADFYDRMAKKKADANPQSGI